MNQSEDFGKILKLRPNLVDHYNPNRYKNSIFIQLVTSKQGLTIHL